MDVHHQQHPHVLHQQQQHLHSQQGSMVHPPMHDVFPLTVGRMHECEQTMAIVEYNKGERAKTTTSDEDEPSFTEGGVDGHGEPAMGEENMQLCKRRGSGSQSRKSWLKGDIVYHLSSVKTSSMTSTRDTSDSHTSFEGALHVRLHLLPDPSLQRSLQLALRSREDDEILDTRNNQQDDVGDDDQDTDSDDHDDEPEENHDNGAMFGFQGGLKEDEVEA
ncbi:hypothetical protein IFM89_031088 [Coptis chinensis]|uniref:Uncharacterized protein n=1 Tax=Coptis chinensis TaxID=261450 RepID=A0A835M7M9_9MAGN|nr:hypothetical protein IFM89_031088 [Coptis chinensis]